MIPKLFQVKPLEGYRLLLEYSNGEKRILDTSYWLEKPMYQELKNVTLFNTVKISGITVMWVNGQDIAPDDLYEYSLPVAVSVII
ncbi:Protein of unknown function DUF2442 [Acididesulfobacillus acetoxydans]|uniref:DUF2442 domain-containing protein n=1 Tax=Acididesulfobacillus acetoxydans TaxID=1561005 RepID=A0A8S0WFK8_9FIRM|nr:DUF2442 domain-containing protein [Acididesulfobacillus acetoxydans]CAA7601142.1 Protein of unknown function DUF2442 [Acididesulfobacillus acetoxydans]CEJ08579.1 Protein of unknown function DUF2442 [Acididesulfobacillus acetoxydans]